MDDFLPIPDNKEDLMKQLQGSLTSSDNPRRDRPVLVVGSPSLMPFGFNRSPIWMPGSSPGQAGALNRNALALLTISAIAAAQASPPPIWEPNLVITESPPEKKVSPKLLALLKRAT